jgi:small conductance mechanosensitive channel
MPEHITNTVTQDVHDFLPLIVPDALSVLGAIAILIIGLWLSGKAHLLVVRALSKAPHVDPMLIGFFGHIVRYLILTVTVLALLSQFGIQTTSLVAVLGAAGLAVGLALQGTLSNLAAGVMLLIFRPFRVGQTVQVGSVQGTVREVALFWTELVTGDNVQIIVPNSGVWGQPVHNFSFYPVRGIEVHFPVPGPVKPDRALAVVRAVVDSDARIVDNPAPGVSLDLADSGLVTIVNAWTASGNLGAVRTDLIRAVREAVDSEAAKEKAPAN